MTEQSTFREILVRELGGTSTLCVCMQNPSRAEADDPTKNDPTIHRLCGFTTRLGFGRLVVVNHTMYRATDPLEMYRWLFTLNMNERDGHRLAALAVAIKEARKADLFVAAWGNGIANDRWPLTFAGALQAAGIDLYAFGLTKLGYPKHPLARGRERIPDDARPLFWKKGAS